MTNKVYYQVKNPVVPIVFANWLAKNCVKNINNLVKQTWFYYPHGQFDNELSTFQLYKIWEELEVPEELLTDVQNEMD